MLLIILVAIGLSMDAFSLSLAYGTMGFIKKERLLLAIIVGIYHFIMPLIGMFLGKNILSIIKISPNLIAFVILFFIGMEMIIEALGKKDDVKKIVVKDFIVFGFAVSIDSFSVGIGLEAMTSNYLLASLIFSILSFSFTLFGLNIGYKVNKILNNVAPIFGGLLLIGIGCYYLLV